MTKPLERLRGRLVDMYVMCGGLIHEVFHQRNTEVQRLAALR